jgi:ribonuclease T2
MGSLGRVLVSVLLLQLTAFFGGASAQTAPACRLPDKLSLPTAKDPDVVNKLPTAYLALVLSWSPEFCASQQSEQERTKHRFQCRDNTFEFVVHGLWPQAKGGTGKKDNPRHCKSSGPLPEALLRKHLCTVPGEALMQNEWQAHGTCMPGVTTPDEYFQAIETAWATFARPTLGQLAGKPMQGASAQTTPATIKKAFVDANPGRLAATAMQVRVRGGNRLSEVWICLDKADVTKSVDCPKGGTPDQQKITIVAPEGGVQPFAAAAPATPATLPSVMTLTSDAEPDVDCPAPQRRFNSYSSAAKASFWSLYANGGRTIYCQAQFGSGGTRSTAGGLPMNIEHALPRSRISASPGQGDLHNLWPSIVSVNSARSNYDLVDDIPGENWAFAAASQPELAACDFEVRTLRVGAEKVTVVEPGPAARGPLARSILHSSLAYRVNLRERDWQRMLTWHRQHPPSAEERRRNDAIADIQGTRNPFVDSPDLAELMVQACRR